MYSLSGSHRRISGEHCAGIVGEEQLDEPPEPGGDEQEAGRRCEEDGIRGFDCSDDFF
jgi:hypothetical protein